MKSQIEKVLNDIGKMAKQLISAQECKEILWKAVNIQANETDIQHELNVMENSFGYIADLAHLTIWMGKGNDEETREEFKFFVKLVPLDSNGKIRRSELTWMFEREAFMYADMLLKFNATEATHWHPKCYLARKDLLVLENLNLSGFKHLTHRTRFDCPLVECVLRSVAAIHADSIAYEMKIHPRTIVDAFGEYREEFGIAPDKIWFQRGLEAIKAIIPMTKSYQRYPEKYRITTFDKLVFPIYEMVKPSSKYRNVFCHQDLWAVNFYDNTSKSPSKIFAELLSSLLPVPS
ncbi:uncharacterized protein LOC119070925 isoform X2 [Bradysia coprophila]|uniref:uncharacterized protein LOC119070925 isoform X2 n=1 Tax=Bradysia coprophila TaxID=38358 RepID=UPI00187D9F6E|nr:uncharacterized protein LOC119070925 isoform X2 [Bradysia coprophila]